MGRKARSRIRTELRRVLGNLDQRWLRAASHQVCLELGQLVNRQLAGRPKHLLLWLHHFPGEIDLSTFINEQILQRHVYLPRSNADRTLTFVELKSDWTAGLIPGSQGILEPRLAPELIYNPRYAAETVVLVPGLAFDRSGNRLGRGMGYYDRFLASDNMEQALRVGVCLSLQVVPNLPLEPQDLPLDWLCSERGLLQVADGMPVTL